MVGAVHNIEVDRVAGSAFLHGQNVQEGKGAVLLHSEIWESEICIVEFWDYSSRVGSRVFFFLGFSSCDDT